MKTYKIDFTRRTVTITKEFAAKAAEYNSYEYKMIVDLQNQGYTVVKRTHATPTNRKPMPTYAQMEHYISCLAEAESYRKQYDAICEEAKSYNNSIAKVRKWFNATFPNYGKLPEFDENNKIIVTPKDHDAKTLKIA